MRIIQKLSWAINDLKEWERFESLSGDVGRHRIEVKSLQFTTNIYFASPVPAFLACQTYILEPSLLGYEDFRSELPNRQSPQTAEKVTERHGWVYLLSRTLPKPRATSS